MEDTFASRIEPGCQSLSPAVGSSRTVISIFVWADDLEKELSMHKFWLLDLFNKLQTPFSLRLNIKVARDSFQSIHVQLDEFVQELDKTSPVQLVVYVYGAERDSNADTGLKADFVTLMKRCHGIVKLEHVLGETAKGTSI